MTKAAHASKNPTDNVDDSFDNLECAEIAKKKHFLAQSNLPNESSKIGDGAHRNKVFLVSDVFRFDERAPQLFFRWAGRGPNVLEALLRLLVLR